MLLRRDGMVNTHEMVCGMERRMELSCGAFDRRDTRTVGRVHGRVWHKKLKSVQRYLLWGIIVDMYTCQARSIPSLR